MLHRQRKKHRSSSRALEFDENGDDTPLNAEPESSRPGLWLVLMVPAAALSLCGSKEPWALGVVALLMALCVVVRPPARSVSPLVWIPLALIPIVTLAAFLPQSLGTAPEWRTILEENFNVRLATTRTPQPWITLDSWVTLTAGIGWLLYCLAQGFSASERRIAVRFLAGFIAALTCAAIYARWAKVNMPLWRAEWDFPYFGPFPNRNNFGGLLSIGAVLGFASIVDCLRQRQPLGWMFFGACVVPLFVAVLLNTSRLGVLLFFSGTGLWMGLATFQKRSAAQAAVTASILLVLASGFFLFGESVMSRFSQNQGSVVRTLAEDGRIQIFADAARLIAKSPLGVGLGNFEPAFAMTRQSFDVNSRAVHPESDWLWLGAEGGLPCLLLAVFALAMLIRGFGPWGGRRGSGRGDRKLRLAATVAALMLPLQALADTPLHAIGLATLGCLLAGMAYGSPIGARPPRVGWRYAGSAGFAATGLACTLFATGSLGYPGTFLYRQLLGESRALSKMGDNAGALALLNAAARIKPLQWNLYFDRAELKQRLGRTSQEALEDFAIARELEPHNGLMCMREVRDWLQYDPPYAIPALREAMRRDKGRAFGFYGDVVNELRYHPELHAGVRTLATNSGLLLTYLNSVWGADFTATIQLMLDKDPGLKDLVPSDRLRVFRLWHDRGDAKALLDKLKGNLEWMKSGWIVVADHQAKEGDFRGAFELATAHVPAPEAMFAPKDANLDAMNRQFQNDPTDLIRGQQLYDAFKSADQLQKALEVLKVLGESSTPPAMVHYERAQLLAKNGNYHDAWLEVREYSEIVEKKDNR